jgi:hypothetical protein
MKTVTRLLVFVILFLFVFPLSIAGAQDDSGGELPVVPEMSAIYYLTAASGSFADQGDGTYLLTLEGVGADITWIMTSPSLAIQQQSSANLSMQWSSADALTTDAVIEAAGLNIAMTLGAPTYDEAAGVQTYVATVTNINAPAGVKEPDVPATFDTASLSMAWSLDFQNGLVSGITAMYAGLRATPEECAAAQQEWNDFMAYYIAKQNELYPIVNACVGVGQPPDPNACIQRQAILDEINAEYAKVSYIPGMLANECN